MKYKITKMENKQIVSFDFDNTLSNKSDVQAYCLELISRGLDVHIVTTRFDDLHKALWKANPSNDDMYKITDHLGIKRENIHFMNFEFGKGMYLFNTPCLWHLDDDEEELDSFDIDGKVKPVNVNKGDWKHICEKILNE